MARSLSSLADNIAERIQQLKCKCRHDDKKCETCKIKWKDGAGVVEYTNVKDALIV